VRNLSSFATRTQDWFAGIAAACDRLVHPSVNGENRARQRRFLGVLLSTPAIATPAIVQTMLPAHGLVGALGLLGATFVASWLLSLYVVLSAHSRGAEGVAIFSAALLVAILTASGGGASAPVAILVLALPLEAFWVSGSRKAAMIALAAGLGMMAAWVNVMGMGGAAAASTVASASLWLSPALYALLLAGRGVTAHEVDPEAEREAEFIVPGKALEAVLVKVSGSGDVNLVSDQARDVMHLEPELLLGTGLFERIHVADRVSFLCGLSAVRDGEVSRRTGLRLRLPGNAGGYAPFEAEIVKQSDDDTMLLVILRDASDIAGLRADLAKAVEQAGATEVAKGRFLAAVSHELRTPLNAIIGFSDMLLHREICGALSEKQEENIALIRDAGNHLLSVVNAILDVSKIESGSYHINVEPFEPQPAVELCRAMLEPQATAKGVTLTTSIPRGIGEIAGDQRAVQQILLNLVSNSIKFTPEGGQVNISAARQGGLVRISVNDTGIGISESDLATLGRPFMQIQNDYTRNYQGTGLGLSLVKGLVELHGGSMSIESAPGLGTTVSVGLPAARGTTSEDEYVVSAGAKLRGISGETHGSALRKIA
jgi:cell cycle sensor histidine kinase DivJ